MLKIFSFKNFSINWIANLIFDLKWSRNFSILNSFNVLINKIRASTIINKTFVKTIVSMIMTNTISQFINSIVMTIISIINLIKFIKVIDKIQIVKKIVNNFALFHSQKSFCYWSTKRISRSIREKIRNFLRLLKSLTITRKSFNSNKLMFLIKKKEEWWWRIEKFRRWWRRLLQ